MIDDDEDDEAADAPSFPRLDEDIVRRVAWTANGVRALLFRLSPREIRAAAIVIATLERLPKSTPGALARVVARTPRSGANYRWASIDASEHGIEFGIGEHFYDADVGGDTTSQTLFALGWDGTSGDVDEWREHWDRIVDGSDLGIEAVDEADESEIDLD